MRKFAVVVWSAVLATSWVAAQAAQHPTYLCIDLHPVGYLESYGLGLDGDQQVGTGRGFLGFDDRHALLWSFTGDAIVNLEPNLSSEAVAVSDGRQVGYAYSPGSHGSHAVLWSRFAPTVDLTPAGFMNAAASGIRGEQQVGSAYSLITSNFHALLWFGRASTVVDLHPRGFRDSYACDTSGKRQVGYGTPVNQSLVHALLWSGRSHTVVDLHPVGFSLSQAITISENEEAGLGYGPVTGQNVHALLWHGRAHTVVDLNPPGYASSACWGNSRGRQVGVGSRLADDGIAHALLWFGTAESFVDLHSSLPRNKYSDSVATHVDEHGNVIGYAYYIPTGRAHAMLWVLVQDPVRPRTWPRKSNPPE